MNKTLIILFSSILIFAVSKCDDVAHSKNAFNRTVPEIHYEDYVSIYSKIVEIKFQGIMKDATFNCFGVGQVYWITPPNFNSQIKKSILFRENCENSTSCSAKMTLKNVSFRMTGYYTCKYRNYELSNDVKILVNDDRNLFSDPDNEVVEVEYDRPAIIPCIVTGFKVNLSFAQILDPLESTVQNVSTSRYLHGIGYYFHRFTLKIGIPKFRCFAKFKNFKQSKRIKLKIKLGPEHTQLPSTPIEISVIEPISKPYKTMNFSDLQQNLLVIKKNDLIDLKCRGNRPIFWTKYNSNPRQQFAYILNERTDELSYETQYSILPNQTGVQGYYICYYLNDEDGYIDDANFAFYQIIVYGDDFMVYRATDLENQQLIVPEFDSLIECPVNGSSYQLISNRSSIDENFFTTDYIFKEENGLAIISTQGEGSALFSKIIGECHESSSISTSTVYWYINSFMIELIEPRDYFQKDQTYKLQVKVPSLKIVSIEWFFYQCNDGEAYCSISIMSSGISIMKRHPKEHTTNVYNNSEDYFAKIEQKLLGINVIARKSGIYRFYYKINDLFIEDIPFFVTDVGGAGITMTKSDEESYETESVTITCRMNPMKLPSFEWYFKPKNSPEIHLLNEDNFDYQVNTFNTDYSRVFQLKLLSPTVNQSGFYYCNGSTKNDGFVFEKISLEVIKAKLPIIVETNLDTDLTIEYKDDVILYCKFESRPSSVISWLKDGIEITNYGDLKFNINSNNGTLDLYGVEEMNNGLYECVAQNYAGSVSKSANLHVNLKYKTSKLMIILLICAIIFILVILSSFSIWIAINNKRKDKFIKSLNKQKFLDGEIEIIDYAKSIFDQIRLTPFDQNFEFPKENLRKIKLIDSGLFGQVFLAKAVGICYEDQETLVAVKMPKEIGNKKHFESLETELKILAKIGKHKNIVNLLGAVTVDYSKGKLHMIVEYCAHGSLLKFLQNRRSNFIDDEAALDFAQKNPLKNELEVDCLSTGTSHFSTIDLLYFAYQVAKGMEYLSSRECLHRDLALRNILLADGVIVKICDFGLAKHLNVDSEYISKGKKKLPFKWMAIESIKNGIFTRKSDVWSFGVVLWEIFTLGMKPYPDLKNTMLYIKLLNGYRLEHPKYSPNLIKKLMTECWLENLEERPEFSNMANQIETFIEEQFTGSIGETCLK